MAIRPQQYRIQWPLTASQVEGIDTMFETLYKKIKELEQRILVGLAEIAASTGDTGSSTGVGASGLAGSSWMDRETDNDIWTNPRAFAVPIPVVDGGTGLTVFVTGDMIYASATNTLARVPGNTTTTQKFLAQSGDGSTAAAPTWVTIPAVGSLVFFFYATASDIATYRVQRTPASTGAVQQFAHNNLAAGDHLLQSFATLSGVPNITFMPGGTVTCYITANRTAGANVVQLFAQFYQRTSGGTETLLATSALSDLLAADVNVAYIVQGAIPSSLVFLATDRVVTKVYAHVISGGATHDVLLSIEGVTAARGEYPSATVDATNFVPYTGATANVDLNSKNLTTTGLVVAGTSVSTPALISTGAMSITPAASSSLNISLATTGDFIVNTDDLVVDTSSGNVGIGQTTPTARLHIIAGTTAAGTAPIKLTAGSNLSVVEAGAIEFDGTHFYGSIGLVRYQLDQQTSGGSGAMGPPGPAGMDGDDLWAALPPTVVSGKEATITTTGNIDNLDFGNVDILRLNNASLSTIRGLKAGTPGQQVTIVSVGAGIVDFAHLNGGSSTSNQLQNAITSGNTPIAAGVGIATYQYDGASAKWRLAAHEQGAYIDMAYNSGNFTAQAGVWTVESGDLITMAYYVRGREVTFKLKILSSATTTAPNYLDAVLPYTCARSEYANLCWGSDSTGTGEFSAYVTLFPEFDTGHNTVVRFYKFNNTAWGTNSAVHVSLSHPYTTS